MQNPLIEKLLELLDITRDGLIVRSVGGAHGAAPMEIEPYDFLLQAEEDFERGERSAEINCLTNAKRAIVSQMDQALLTFGYKSFRWNIPKKLDVLTELGFVAPRILKRVSAARNMLEHEYKRPTPQEIEDALDLAWLFVSASQAKLHPFGDTFYISDVKYLSEKGSFSKFLSLGLDYDGESVSYDVRAMDKTSDDVVIGVAEIRSGEPGFSILVRLADAADTGVKLEKVLDEFASFVFAS